MKKDLEPSPSHPNCSKDYWKLLTLLISINWPSLMTWWVEIQKIYSEMYLVLCTDTHRDITDLVNHGMVKNTKTWISWEWNITFPRNKKILNLHLKWHILRSYHFEAEVTFKIKVWMKFFTMAVMMKCWIEDEMLYYGCNDLGLQCWKLKMLW